MHSTSDTRTKRLLDLVVLLLDARRPISFAELREQFSEYRSAKPEAGQRAYERDKSTLLEMGVPLRYVTAEESADAPAEGGYIIDRQKYRLPEVSLTADEVAVLVSTAAAARHQSDFPYRHAAELAVRKLMFDLSGLPSKSRRRRPPPRAAEGEKGEKGGPAAGVLVHLPTTFKSGSIAEHLEQLEGAIHNHKRVSFEYGAHRGSGWGGADEPAASEGGVVGPSERDVDPYGLVYRQGAWLLVGFCHKAQAIRRFRVDRILQLKVAPRPRTPDFEVPKDFSLQEHGVISPWRFDREPPVRARLWVSDETPWVVDEDFGPTTRAAAQDHGASGSVVEFDCKNPDYLVSRVLGAAGTLRVLAPPALRTRVAEAAATVGRRNGPQSGGARTVSVAEVETPKSAPRGATAS
jgi:proteasome accessory factor B